MHCERTLIATLLVAAIHTTAAAEQGELDPLDQLQGIRDSFRRGNYEAVVRASEQLLEGEPSILVRAEALQYLGASLGLLDRTSEANDAFETLVNLQPEWAINRSEFPTDVISLFDSVRDRVEDNLSRIDEQRRRAQAAQQRERERQLAERHQRLIDLARPRYLLQDDAYQGHLIAAFLPFGAGQFQNGQTNKGYAFLGVELGLTAASMTLWLLGTLWSDEDGFNAYQVASYAVYGTLAISVLWGIIDGVVNFVRRRRSRPTWREVEEREVPPEYRVDLDRALDELENQSRDEEPSRDAQQER